MFTVTPFESRTVSWWYDQRNKIDFSPHYQRKGNIWSIADKAYLIDSILNDFDMPKLYMADYSFGTSLLSSSPYRYAVVDGKQRFEAIFDFYEDKVKLSTDFVYQENTSIRVGGLKFSEIRMKYPEIARKFENYNISIMRIVTDEEGKINDLFVRLNRSRPLTGAELRAAMNGKAPYLIKELSENPLFSMANFSIKRAQDQNTAAKFLLIEFMGGFVQTSKKNLDNLVEIALSSESDLDGLVDAAKRVDANLNNMTKVFVDKDPLLSAQGPLTIYYWLVRNTKPEEHKYIREFLLLFNNSRKGLSQEKARNDHFLRDLYIYNTQSNSINNKGSMEVRYNILDHYFQQYLETSDENIN